MAIKEIGSFQQLLDAIEDTKQQKPIFRGHGNASWKLIPKIGRVYLHRLAIDKRNQPKRVYVEEIAVLEDFKRRSTPYIKKIPDDDWQWLALAQHHGLTTRLLDWTDNPLVAAFFACFEQYMGDSAIYVLDRSKINLGKNNEHPFSLKEPKLFEPHHLSPRITAQAGLFTIHNTPHIELVDELVDKWIIKQNCLINIGVKLERFGFNYQSLFPGLDGLTQMLIHKFLLYDK